MLTRWEAARAAAQRVLACLSEGCWRQAWSHRQTCSCGGSRLFVGVCDRHTATVRTSKVSCIGRDQHWGARLGKENASHVVRPCPARCPGRMPIRPAHAEVLVAKPKSPMQSGCCVAGRVRKKKDDVGGRRCRYGYGYGYGFKLGLYRSPTSLPLV